MTTTDSPGPPTAAMVVVMNALTACGEVGAFGAVADLNALFWALNRVRDDGGDSTPRMTDAQVRQFIDATAHPSGDLWSQLQGIVASPRPRVRRADVQTLTTAIAYLARALVDAIESGDPVRSARVVNPQEVGSGGRDDPDAETADGWRDVAAALEPAAEAWSAVSPESAGPVRELLRDARWNAHVFQRLTDGVPRAAAWRDADAEVGPRPDPTHIVYEPAAG